MDKDEQEHQKFLFELLDWCKEQNRILVKIEMILHEIKQITIYLWKINLIQLKIIS